MTVAVESFWRRLRYTRLRDVFRGRFDGQLDWRYTLADADVPTEVADVISQVIGKTRLWNREKRDVAQELIAHFQDGLETGLSGEELLATFGAAKSAALLIRRSKKRGRPLVWQAWWWASRSLAAFFAAYAFAAVLLAFDRPKISTDYMAILNKQIDALPEEERAWPHYMLALEWLKTNTEVPPSDLPNLVNPSDVKKLSVGFWLRGPKGDETYLLDEYPSLDDVQRDVVDTWLEDRKEFFAYLREATRYRHLGLASGKYSAEFRRLFGMPLSNANVTEKASSAESSMYYTQIPHVQAMRGLARVLKADLQRSVRQGEGATAFADLQAMIAITRHSGDDLWLVAGLVKCSILNYTIERIKTVLSSNSKIWTDKNLADAAHLLGTVRLEVDDYVQGEKAMFYDLVQRLYSDNGDGDGYLTAEGLRVLDQELKLLLGVNGSLQEPYLTEWQYIAAAPATYLVAASRREIVAKSDEMWARLQTAADRPLWDPLPREETADGLFQQMSQIEKFRFAPLSMCFPAYQAASRTFEKARGRREGALVGIALELYRREHGEWPESLKRLSPRWLPEVPIDRVNGGPLGYRIVEGQPVVYSLGVDADDDGGVLPGDCNGDPRKYVVHSPSSESLPSEDGDWVIWSTVRKNTEADLQTAE